MTDTMPMPVLNEHGMTAPSPPLFENQALTYEDLMARLKVPKRSLERLVSADEIPHRKIGHYVRFYWPAIAAWLSKEKGRRSR